MSQISIIVLFGFCEGILRAREDLSPHHPCVIWHYQGKGAGVSSNRLTMIMQMNIRPTYESTIMPLFPPFIIRSAVGHCVANTPSPVKNCQHLNVFFHFENMIVMFSMATVFV